MLLAVLAGLFLISVVTLVHQPLVTAASDFDCFWAGARVALHDPHRLYDFAYVTQQQGWPFGPGKLRPFAYPPSSLALFIPFALAPYWVAYGLWVFLTGAAFLWAGLKARAPWWFILLPPVVFAAFCGQITLLIGALVIGGLALGETRPLAAGLLFGVAAALKPQLVLLVPVALAAEGRWRTLLAAGATAGALAAVSAAIWGVGMWFDWLAALPRFQAMIFGDIYVVMSTITPYATLQRLGVAGAWAYLLAPFAPLAVWIVFRRTQSLADRSLALFVGALAVSPYAMNYEAALLAPAVATYLVRTNDRRWLAYAVAAIAYTPLSLGVTPLVAAAALPAIRRTGVPTEPYSAA